MELKNFWAQDSAGNSVASPTVTVYAAGTTTLATGLVNGSGAGISNPFTGTIAGQITFAAPDGDYDVSINGGSSGTISMRVRFISNIGGSGEVNTASNLGSTGEGLFASKVGVDLRFKKIAPGDNVSFTVDGEKIIINSTGGGGSAVEFSSYSGLRAYTGTTTPVRVTSPLLAGHFYLDGSDTSSADNGGTIIVDALSRRWKREYSGFVKAAWFGAVGGGTDCTAAISAAFAASDAVHLDDWYYVSSGFNIPSGRNFMLTGIGQAKSGLWYTGSSGVTVLTFNKSYSTKHVLTVGDVGFRSQVAGNTAIKVQAELTAASVQVNGQMDAAFINDVNISSESSTYWTTGIHIVNGGGIHLSRVKIENRDSAQSIAGVRGIYLQQTDSRAYMIRTLTASDIYIVRANTAIETSTVSTSSGIESIYATGGEIIANKGFVANGFVSAIRMSGLHMDVIEGAIDCASAVVTASRFVGCDFRKANNGGSYTAGPLLKFDYGEGVTFTGCFLSGANESVPSSLNLAIKFSNTLNGTGLMRSSFTGNTFRGHYYVYGVTPAVNGVTAAGNNYGAIAGAVNQNTDEDISIAKHDSVISYSFIVALNTSGDQVVSHTPPNALKYFDGAHTVVIPTIASTHSQQLAVSYDFDSSSNSNFVFRVKGNTAGAQNVRISYLAMGQSVSSTN